MEFYLGLLVVLGAYGAFAVTQPRKAFLFLFLGYTTVYPSIEVPVAGPETVVSTLDLMFLILIVVVFVTIWADRGVELPADRFLTVGVGSFFFVVIALPLAYFALYESQFSVLTQGIRHLQWFLFLPVGLALSSQGHLRAGDILKLLPLIILPHIAYSILQLLVVHGPEIGALDAVYVHPGGRATGLFSQPNKLGFLCALVALVAMPYVFLRNEQNWALLVTVLFSLVGLLITESRASIVAFIFGVGFLLALELRAVNWKQIFPIAGVVCGLLVIDAGLGTRFHFVERLASITQIVLQGPKSVSSMAARFEHWESAAEVYENVGFWGSWAAAREFGLTTDNYYVALLVQAGPVGVLSILALYLGLFRYGFGRYVRFANPFCLGLCLCVLGVAASSVLYNSFPYQYVQMFIWTMVAIITHSETTRMLEPDGQSAASGGEV